MYKDYKRVDSRNTGLAKPPMYVQTTAFGEMRATPSFEISQVSEDKAGLGPMGVVGVLRKVYVKSKFGWVSTGVTGRILQTM